MVFFILKNKKYFFDVVDSGNLTWFFKDLKKSKNNTALGILSILKFKTNSRYNKTCFFFFQ